MAIWYEMEKSPKGISNFLNSNWGFHDFRLEKVEFIPGKDCVEIFLKYDTGNEGVLLRFAWIQDMHIQTKRDYDVDWIFGCVLIPVENNCFIWLDDDTWGKSSVDHLDELKAYTTWVEAERLFWAITDGDGNPVEMPPDRIDQTWNSYGKILHKHFDLNEFRGDWNLILKPPFYRLSDNSEAKNMVEA